MTGAVHIWTTNAQPATRWRIYDSPWFRCSPFKRLECHNCGRSRQARNLSVKAYYDTVHVFCTDKGKCRA